MRTEYSSAGMACIVGSEDVFSLINKSWRGVAARSRLHWYARLSDIPSRYDYQFYFVEDRVPDLGLWPLPLLSRGRRVPSVSAFLICHAQGRLYLQPMPVHQSLCAEEPESERDLASLVCEIISPESAMRIRSVDYFEAFRGFLIRMRNGKAYFLPLKTISGADGSEIKGYRLSEDGHYFEIEQESGNTIEVPWDAVLYHCEPEYEYSEHGAWARDQESNERAQRIAGRVRDLRRSESLSIAELARRSGMHRPNLSRLEAGKHVPSLDVLERIAEALRVPVARLVARG